MHRKVIRPMVLDLAKSDKELRALLRRDTELQSQISPVITLIGHGIEAMFRSSCRKFVESHEESGEESGSVSLDCSDTKVQLVKLSWRIAGIFDIQEELSRRDLALGGPLNIRYYPFNKKSDGVSLGAHVDANLFTLLWQSSPGLQVVVETPQRAIQATDVIGFGIPSIGPVRQVVDQSNWVTVDTPADAIILTFGREWLSSFAQTRFPVRCPVLHRVKLDKAPENQQFRISIPFLVRLHDKTSDDDSHS